MSRRGNCWDNAVAESFFATVKVELAHEAHWATRRQARSEVFGHSSIQVTVDLYGHFIPGEDRHHVESMAEAIEEARTQEAATLPQPNGDARS